MRGCVRSGVVAVGLAGVGSHACGPPVESTGESAEGGSTGFETGEGTASESGPRLDLPASCVTPELDERELLRPGDGRLDVELVACTRDLWWVAWPAGSTHVLRVTSGTPVSVRVVYPDTLDWSAPVSAVEGEGVLELPVVSPRSGELAVLVGNPDLDAGLRYDISLACTDGCELSTTRFPIVLVHGWTGFENVGPIDYFYGVPDDLRGRGYPIEIAVLDPYNSVEVRSAQLAEFVDQALADERARRVDIVAHSQGGLDSRYLISTLGYGDRVDALTTVATPHRGTPLADVALGLEPGPTDETLYFLLNLLGAAGGNQSDAEASFWSLSETYVQGEFNPQNPDDARVDYVSWMGETCLSLLDCEDAVDAPILAGYQLLAGISGENDGVVPVSSAPWGEYRGTVAADHFDEVGQVAGVTGPNFDHREFYRGLAGDLRAAGH